MAQVGRHGHQLYGDGGAPFGLNADAAGRPIGYSSGNIIGAAMRLSTITASFFAVTLLATPAFAQSEEDVMNQIENIHGDSVGFGEAFARLQDAFLFGDPTSIADQGAYPLTVHANGEVYDILEAQDLVDNFDTLVTQDTIDALSSQDYADLIVTSEGVGFGNGVLWMSNICYDDACNKTAWAIIAINN
jgi:hypothetical protein